jgi:hypothetical protein
MNAASKPAMDVNTTPSPGDWRTRHGLTKPHWAKPEDSLEYANWLLSFQKRPWDWVCVCYPWGEVGSGLRMPELWQREWLKSLQVELNRTADRITGEPFTVKEIFNRVIRMATAAGHGVGKTSLVAWVIHWFCSVYPNSQAVITASTAAQLETKTGVS